MAGIETTSTVGTALRTNLLAVLVTGPLLNRREAVAGVIDGNTTRNIEAGPHIKTERPQTGLGERLAVIPLAIASRVRGNSLVDRAATCPAVPEEHPAWAIAAAGQVLATGRAEAERIA
jgi:hypothetical protein